MGIWDRDYMKSPLWRRRQAAWEAAGRAPHAGEPRLPFSSRVSARPRRRAGRDRTTIAFAAVTAAAAALTGAYALGQEAGIGPFAPPSVEWGGERFESRAELAEWLELRGVSYGEWAEKHPAAAAKLRP